MDRISHSSCHSFIHSFLHSLIHFPHQGTQAGFHAVTEPSEAIDFGHISTSNNMDQASSTATLSNPACNLVHRGSARPASQTSGSSSYQTPVKNTAELKKAQTRSTKYRHVAAVHSESRPSTLSHDASATPSFIGFRNLGLIVLIAGNLRLVLENIQKYGVLICVRCHDFRRQDLVVGAVVYTLVPVSLIAAFGIEYLASQNAKRARKRARSDSLRKARLVPGGAAAAAGEAATAAAGGGGENDDGIHDVDGANDDDGAASPTLEQQARFRRTWHMIAIAHVANVSTALVLTSWAVYRLVNHPLIGTAVEMHAIIVWLKTASYALTNRDLRHAFLHPHKGEAESIPALYSSCAYPENVTIGNLCYFWWAPTLIYQPVYPRTDKIRWVFVLKRVGETAGLCVVMWVLSAQYAAPTLQNSIRAWQERDVPSLLERVLKLSTVSLVIWLAGFFALFQSTLNALAEVMKFADRCFYEDCTCLTQPVPPCVRCGCWLFFASYTDI